MQAKNLPDADALVLDELAELLGVLVDEVPLDPHAAASKATTLRAPTVVTVPLTVTSSAGAARGRPEGLPAQSGALAG
jgi:hypothetical protein